MKTGVGRVGWRTVGSGPHGFDGFVDDGFGVRAVDRIVPAIRRTAAMAVGGFHAANAAGFVGFLVTTADFDADGFGGDDDLFVVNYFLVSCSSGSVAQLSRTCT